MGCPLAGQMPTETRMSETRTDNAPLAGIRVIELARILAGPWAGQLLADLGADVIKIEHPEGGDDTRRWGPPFVTGRRWRKPLGRLLSLDQPRQALDHARHRQPGGRPRPHVI
jgi:hypothetical protein